jgi:hypothetical protein
MTNAPAVTDKAVRARPRWSPLWGVFACGQEVRGRGWAACTDCKGGPLESIVRLVRARVRLSLLGRLRPAESTVGGPEAASGVDAVPAEGVGREDYWR